MLKSIAFVWHTLSLNATPLLWIYPFSHHSLNLPCCFAGGKCLTSYILPGSRLIISSPVQPMMQHMVVPVSVVGQNNAGQFSIVPNQVSTPFYCINKKIENKLFYIFAFNPFSLTDRLP